MFIDSDQPAIQEKSIHKNTSLSSFTRLILQIATLVFAFLSAGLHSFAAEQRYFSELDILEVMFIREAKIRLVEGHPVDLEGNALAGVQEILDPLGPVAWEPMIPDQPPEQLDEFQAVAESNLEEPLYNFNNALYLHIDPEHDIWGLAEALEELPGIRRAMPVPRPVEPPAIPNYEPNQGYLKEAKKTPPTGLGSYYAWTKPWGDGTSVRICDLEYGFNLNHVDITRAKTSNVNPYFPSQPYGISDIHHGTAVIGQLVADYNGTGITGMAKGAGLLTFPTNFSLTPQGKDIWHLPPAIVLAALSLAPGDVILLEQQWDRGKGKKLLVPIEWWGDTSKKQSNNAVYAAIKLAVGNGIHVVEAAGNGNQNLDKLSWFGDSGAVIVGAGGVSKINPNDPGDLEKIFSSSYGNRVNLQGWGEEIYTTGYGDKYGSNSTNDSFTESFGGTSGASAMIAAAISSSVGYWKMGLQQPAASLTPAMLRSVLINTGTTQIDTGFIPAPIGPRPDLKNAFTVLENMAPQYLQWVDVEMPATKFKAGDNFFLHVKITNNLPTALGNTSLMVVLEIGGFYFFYPSWSTAVQMGTVNVGTGTQTVVIIPKLPWPAGFGKYYGAKVYAAMLNSSFGIIGKIGYWEFSWL